MSIMHNAGIILIFLEHNTSVSENCERCMQICEQLALRECAKLTKEGNIFRT